MSIWVFKSNYAFSLTELYKCIGLYSIVISIFLLSGIPVSIRVKADSYILVNSTVVSICVTESLPNGISIEASIDNKMPENFSTTFRPEYLFFNTRDSTLLISYDARI
ncbi:MAG: hypothetical protein NZ873_03270, partial [Crenarchaeota archaeon]|nr:hypothetical protein [Thermoproteota archaeon]